MFFERKKQEPIGVMIVPRTVESIYFGHREPIRPVIAIKAIASQRAEMIRSLREFAAAPEAKFTETPVEEVAKAMIVDGKVEEAIQFAEAVSQKPGVAPDLAEQVVEAIQGKQRKGAEIALTPAERRKAIRKQARSGVGEVEFDLQLNRKIGHGRYYLTNATRRDFYEHDNDNKSGKTYAAGRKPRRKDIVRFKPGSVIAYCLEAMWEEVLDEREFQDALRNGVN